MKSYLSLVPISAKVHKRQSRMTRICIILAVFLVTSIFSMVEMWTKAETTAMRHNHGDWHIALQNIQDNEAEQIRKDNDVAFSSWYDSINANAEQDYYIGGKNAVIYGIEEAYSTNIMNYPTEGNYPQNEKEVVLSADAKELFGVKVGDSITLNTHAGDLGYTITGFYQDDSEFNSMVNGICVYVNRDTFNHIRSLNGETSASQFYIRFQHENRLKKTIADFKLKYNLTDENVKENFRLIAQAANIPVENITAGAQDHHTNVRRVTMKNAGTGIWKPKDMESVDGLVTDEPNLPLLIYAADCVPLYFYDPIHHAIGLSHAGWRGTVNGMAKATVEKMQEEFDTRPEDLLAAIGPSIAKECFEVDAPCAEEFLALPDSDKFVTDDGNGKFHVDLWACNRAFLLGAGVLPEHITTGGVCTVCNSDLLFSHRVTRGKRGSNAGFLMLREQNA